MKFSTAGSMGDSVYSTLFMEEISDFTHEPLTDIHLQINKQRLLCTASSLWQSPIDQRSS